MKWFVKCDSYFGSFGVTAVNRDGYELDRTPDQSKSIIFNHKEAAEFFASALSDLSDPYDPDSFVVEPYSFD